MSTSISLSITWGVLYHGEIFMHICDMCVHIISSSRSPIITWYCMQYSSDRDDLGPVSIWKCCFTGIGIPMIKMRRSWECLIFIIVIPILVRLHLYTETAPWSVRCLLWILWKCHKKNNKILNTPWEALDLEAFAEVCGERVPANITRTRWRRVKTLGQHQVGVNLQSHARHQLWISTWHIFHEFHKIMPG